MTFCRRVGTSLGPIYSKLDQERCCCARNNLCLTHQRHGATTNRKSLGIKRASSHIPPFFVMVRIVGRIGQRKAAHEGIILELPSSSCRNCSFDLHMGSVQHQIFETYRNELHAETTMVFIKLTLNQLWLLSLKQPILKM